MPKISEFQKITLWLIAWLSWVLALLWLSLIHLESIPVQGWLAWDKLHHATAHGLMTWLGGRSLSLMIDRRLGWVFSAGIAILFGAGLELLQMRLTSHRSGEWGDLLADGIGAALVCSVALIIGRSRRRKGRP